MIGAGKIACFRCGEVSSETYYYAPEGKLVLRAVKSEFGCYKIYDINENAEVELVRRPVTKNGLLVKAKIRVKYSENNVKTYLIGPENRICKHCYDSEKKIQFVSSTMGFEDTYIVGVLGRPNAGKTALIDSSTRAITVDEGTHMYLDNKTAEEIVRYAVTPLGGRKNLVREMKINDKKGNACVRLLVNDTPGEYLTLKKEDRGDDHTYFANYVDLCDGFIYVVESGDCNTQNLNWMDFLPKGAPVAIVMSKLDKLEAETEKNDGVYLHGETPIMTSAYFKKRKKSQKPNVSEMVENQLVDKYILRTLCPALHRIDSNRENVAYFAVSAGSPVETDAKVLDLSKGYNVYAPVVFMAKYWGIR